MPAEIRSVESGMNQLLSDMKKLRGQVLQDNILSDEVGIAEGKKNTLPEFSDILKNAINQVNDAQQASGSLKKAYELGDPNVDITQVMVASQKASIAFEAMKQVRNKLVESYKEIMNMPI